MPVPFALALPAAAASLAYLNARASLSNDIPLFKCLVRSVYRILTHQRAGTINFFCRFEEQAKLPRIGSKPFLIFEGRTTTWDQAYAKILSYGQWLKSRCGVKPGDMVALDYQNSDTFVFLWFAIWEVGATPAFINYNLSGKPLIHCMKTNEAKVCIVDPNVAHVIDDALKEELPAVNFVFFTPEVQAEADAAAPIRAPDADRFCDNVSNTALLIYTSGTTGLPKPAIVSWGKIWYASTIGETLLERGGDDIIYTSMPLYHSSAAVLSLCATVMAGSTQAIGRKFSTKLFWEEVRASKATIIQYVGETLRYLLAAPPQRDPVTGEDLDRKHHVKFAFGNGLRPDVWNKFKDRFGVEGIVEFYAATESPGGLWNVSKNEFGAGAVGRSGWLYGRALAGTQGIVELDHATDLPVRDAQTGLCKRVRPGEPGELLFFLNATNTGDSFPGYHKDASATSAKILRDVFKKGDAWFRTGDLMRIDAEGRAYFLDRIGDTFRWKSENVSTTEVSEALGTHPSVREANVYGVALPHHDGRAGCASVTFDTPSPSPSTLRALAAHVRSSLPRYAQPLFLRLVPDIAGEGQTTGTNKQQKHVLRARGVRPGPDVGEIFWLRGEEGYVPFTEEDWGALEGGRVKL